MGWIALWIGKFAGQLPYNHPMFAIPVFGVAFLAAINSSEKENELDLSISKSILEGIEFEKRSSGLKSACFQDLANSYEGWGMRNFALIRISPAVMILVSLLNAGPLRLLADCVSGFVPSWIVYAGSGAVLAFIGLFLSQMACGPYYWLLSEMKTKRTVV